MNVELDELNECEWLLKVAIESDGQIKYYVHGKAAVSVGGRTVEVKDEKERSRWRENIRILECDGHVKLLNKRVGSLTFGLVD